MFRETSTCKIGEGKEMIEKWNIILTIGIVSFGVIHFGLYFLFLRRETEEKKNESHKKRNI